MSPREADLRAAVEAGARRQVEQASRIAHLEAELSGAYADAKRCRELLRSLEWSDTYSRTCSECDRTERQGHRPGCELAAALEAK